MKSLFSKTVTLLIFSIFILGCSKDRIEEDKNSYESMDDYLDSKKQEEQIFTITEDGECPLIGKEGTKICGAKAALTPTTDWPYTVKLVELLNPKEMIYYRHSNTNAAGFMTSDGEIRLKAYKDDNELAFTTGSSWQVELPNSNPLADMKVYYGSGGGDDVAWNSTSSGDFATSTYGYDGLVNTFGWITAAKKAATSTSTSTFTFTSSTDELDHVVIYIYLDNQKSLTQVHDQVSTGLPIGEAVTIIMMAIDSDGDLYAQTSTLTVDGDTTIDVELAATTDDNLTAILDSL